MRYILWSIIQNLDSKNKNKFLFKSQKTQSYVLNTILTRDYIIDLFDNEGSSLNFKIHNHLKYSSSNDFQNFILILFSKESKIEQKDFNLSFFISEENKSVDYELISQIYSESRNLHSGEKKFRSKSKRINEDNEKFYCYDGYLIDKKEKYFERNDNLFLIYKRKNNELINMRNNKINIKGFPNYNKNSCFINAGLQILKFIPEFNNLINEKKEKRMCKLISNLFLGESYFYTEFLNKIYKSGLVLNNFISF